MGWLRTCPQILRPDWKGFPKTNTLAYWASSSVTKKKSFLTLTPGCRRCYKNLLFFVAEAPLNKLECLYLAITFQSSLPFAGSTRSLPKKEACERCSNYVCQRKNTLAYFDRAASRKKFFYGIVTCLASPITFLIAAYKKFLKKKIFF